LVAEITQRRGVKARNGRPGFGFYGGATAIIDPKGSIRFIIRKSVLDCSRMRRQQDFMTADAQQFFGPGPGNMLLPEPSLLLKLHNATRPRFFTAAATRDNADKMAADAVAKSRSETDTATFMGRAPSPGPATQMAFPLLNFGANSSSVTLLKSCLNRCVIPPPGLDSNSVFDLATERAVGALQAAAGVTVDRIVGPATWTVIGRLLKYSSLGLSIAPDVPLWIVRLLSNDPGKIKMQGLDPQGAFGLYQFGYGPMSSSQREGFVRLLRAIMADTDLNYLRWAAYMLATVKHECAETWQPMEEIGKGAGRAYGEAMTVTDGQGGFRNNIYYGRGYVQLTWENRYKVVGNALGMGNSLLFQPELALVPETAYKIMSYGLRNGLFTGRRLEMYIAGGLPDYEGARRIINGTDQAGRIAGYARQFETILSANIE
jgi:hypothetical protein